MRKFAIGVKVFVLSLTFGTLLVISTNNFHCHFVYCVFIYVKKVLVAKEKIIGIGVVVLLVLTGKVITRNM